MKIVITIGGSVMLKNYESAKFNEYSEILNNLNKEHEIYIIIGGGKPARDYIGLGREIGINEACCDDIGIEITRINAKLFILALGDNAYPIVPHNFNQAKEYGSTNKIVVMGGTEPSHSTDAVGAILAEFIDADLIINLTSVNGFYDKDPNKSEDAEFYPEININEVISFLSGKDVKAGTYEFLDMTAAQIIKRSSIKTIIANGNDPSNLLKALKEEIGTSIVHN